MFDKNLRNLSVSSFQFWQKIHSSIDVLLLSVVAEYLQILFVPNFWITVALFWDTAIQKNNILCFEMVNINDNKNRNSDSCFYMLVSLFNRIQDT